VTARAFADLYRARGPEFPPECRSADYEKRLQAAFPIHPEIFDRLYEDWSTLVKFQRTRGVLRLMAAVIHSLWEKGDRNPLILPSTLPIDDARVQFELTRYLSDNWVPIIEKDVDGPSSLPLKIDAEVPNLGKLHATRRVARTICLGSAPTAAAAHRGLEDRRLKLGCVMPGESAAVFGDALRRLAAAATYLYQDGARAWYATQPTVTKLAEDRAEQSKRDPDKVARGSTPRLYRNTLVFLAADKVRLQDLDEALRKYLAWASILAEKETLDLSPLQVRQAETQKQAADAAVTARLPETYQWVLVPEQKTPACAAAHRRRCARRPREQEAQVRGAVRREPGFHDPAQALGRGAAVARRPRRRSAARRGLRALPVPAAAGGAAGTGAGDARRRGVAHLAVRHVCLCREPRRGGWAVSRPARRPARLARDR
jgi:hypothetical protein